MRGKKQEETKYQVQLPTIQPELTTWWEYRLKPDGFEAKVCIELPDKTVTMCHVMPWQQFIEGLSLGWKKYHQENTEITQQIDQFIQEQMAAGNYSLHEQER